MMIIFTSFSKNEKIRKYIAPAVKYPIAIGIILALVLGINSFFVIHWIVSIFSTDNTVYILLLFFT